jgi:hypothetical protein
MHVEKDSKLHRAAEANHYIRFHNLPERDDLDPNKCWWRIARRNDTWLDLDNPGAAYEFKDVDQTRLDKVQIEIRPALRWCLADWSS